MTKGQLEAKIGNEILKFHINQLGRGAESVKTYIVDDMIIIRLTSVLTPAEKQLAATEHGKHLIKELRYELEEIIRKDIECLIQELTELTVLSIHNDISTKTGERVDIIILNKNLEEILIKNSV